MPKIDGYIRFAFGLSLVGLSVIYLLKIALNVLGNGCFPQLSIWTF